MPAGAAESFVSRLCTSADACSLIIRFSVFKQVILKRDWNAAKPSHIKQSTGSLSTSVTYDDDFVDELKRTIKACKLFLFLPITNLADGGLSSVITSMAAQMTTK